MNEIIEIKIDNNFEELIAYQRHLNNVICSALEIPYSFFSKEKKGSRTAQFLLTEGTK